MEHNDLFTADRPRYLQLYEILRSQITEGLFPFDSRFPSKRTLSDRYGISLITVEHTLELLMDEGYLEARERSGYFVSFRENDSFASAGHILPAIESVSQEKHDFPFSVYAKTMRRVINEYNTQIMDRTPGTGLYALKMAISSYLGRSRLISAAPEQIIIGSGSEYLYGQLIQLLGREKNYAIETPSYAQIEKVYNSQGIYPDLLPLGSEGIQSFALQNTAACYLHITPYRSYPTGISTTASKRREYIRWVNAIQGRYLIEDDFESEFTPSTKPEETLFSLSTKDNVIYLNSFSKTIAPSLRISYLILPEKLVPLYQEKLGFLSCSVPCFEQYVLTELLNSGEFERHLNRVRRKNRQQTE